MCVCVCACARARARACVCVMWLWSTTSIVFVISLWLKVAFYPLLISALNKNNIQFLCVQLKYNHGQYDNYNICIKSVRPCLVIV